MSSIIPLSAPCINGNEWRYIKECLDTEWVSTAGKYVNLFEQMIAKYTGSNYAVACVNGTSALQISLQLAGVKSDDEVIVPTLTFIAPVNAIIYNNASPIFMDADKYFNLDADKTIQFILNETVFINGSTYNKITQKRISAIIPVHVWGNACDLDLLVNVCNERNISIVEDASESLGTFYTQGKYCGKHTGTIGAFGCISFNGNKIITCGGGGVILTDDRKMANKARYLTTQAKDDPVKYIHNEVGYNFRLTNIQAALGVAQLEQLPKYLEKKRENHKQYVFYFKTIDGLSIAKTPEYSNNNYWLNILQIDNDKNEIDSLMCVLEKNGIQTRPIWHLNHLQKPFEQFQSYQIDNARLLVDRSLCIPSSISLTINDIKKITSYLL
jgi:aminotransferase in exopolysaccharide biosynthesis